MDPRVSQIIQILEDCVSGFFSQVSNRNDELDQTNGNLTTEKLAFSVNLSETRFRALFKAEIGMTPAQYLKNLKMVKAREMAKNTHLKITEILSILDVTDQSHFLRDVKKVYGVTLTEYRKQFGRITNS